MDRRSFLIAAAIGPMALAHVADLQAQPPVSGTREVAMVGRRSWRALSPRSGLQRHRPVRLTLHHSGVRLTDDSEAPGRVRQHQRWHMIEKGHPDIDYHYLVDRRGTIYEGRDPAFRGDTQTDYDPTGHLLVCCEGDYQGTTGPAQQPTAAMIRSVSLVFAAAAQRWDIDPGTVRGHRNYTDMTSCPGGTLQRLVRNGSLEARIDALVTAGPVRLARLPRAEGRATVRRIESGT